MLENMLWVCVVDIKGHWDQFLPLYEFCYNNNYHSNTNMALFEVLYGRRYISSIGWFEVGVVKPLDNDLLKDS